MREDVNAAISTFMQSLSTSMGIGGYNKNHMIDYIPAILFTLYDGYYIYSPERTTDSNGNTVYEYMLKPYNYYTVRYRQSDSNDVVINYTLDNYIVVYGWIGGKYVVNSGYLVSNDRKSNVAQSETIEQNVPYQTIPQNVNQKFLVGKKEVTSLNFDPDYISDDRTEYLYPRNDLYYIDPESAVKYYENAKEFTDWVKTNLGWVNANMAMRNNKYLKESHEEFDVDQKIFNINTGDNDPEDSESIFAQHKTNAIKYSIQDNLNQAITAYSQGSVSTYDFKLPKLSLDEWDIVASNICMLTFMQGIPIGTKYYNGYSLVQSTRNKLYVSPDSLYFISEGDNYYHKIDCPYLQGDNIQGFSNFDFLPKKTSLRSDELPYYMYLNGSGTPLQACYYCIVDSNYKSEDWERDTVRAKAYYTALAREKYRRYTATDNLEYNIN